MYIYICIYVYIYICIYVYIYMYICIYICIYVYIYIYICIYVYIYIVKGKHEVIFTIHYSVSQCYRIIEFVASCFAKRAKTYGSSPASIRQGDPGQHNHVWCFNNNLGGVFHKWVPPNGLFINVKYHYHVLNWMIWGYPYFRKPLDSRLACPEL